MTVRTKGAVTFANGFTTISNWEARTLAIVQSF